MENSTEKRYPGDNELVKISGSYNQIFRVLQCATYTPKTF